MQTPAEAQLIAEVKKTLQKGSGKQRILNIGAGSSILIEKTLTSKKYSFVVDRVDVEDCSAKHANIENCSIAPAENMKHLKSSTYDAAFANYVFEHVQNPQKAAKEAARILKKGGTFVISIPNPRAPEFLISAITPLWFHQLIRGKGEGSRAHETAYQFKSVDHLISMFKKAGFKPVSIDYYPTTYFYLSRFPIIAWISKFYDSIVQLFRIRPLMGNVCLVFRKILN